MKEYIFKYKEYNGRYHPIIPVVLFTKVPIQLDAYVDSGASYSIFLYQEEFGIDLEEGNLIYITVGDGGSIPVYIHKIKIGIGEERVNAKIGISKRLGIGFNILGRRDIFEIFDVCFSDKKKEVRLLMEEE